LFPQVGLKFLQNRDNPDAFEPIPTLESALAVTAPKAAAPNAAALAPTVYTIGVNGQSYVVEVAEGGDISAVGMAPVAMTSAPASGAVPVTGGEPVTAPLAGNIWKVHAVPGQAVQEGDVLFILEAMKMETEIRASKSGTVSSVTAKEGDSVSVGDTLLTLA
jgi:oxaloacetate decarboxylase alpha subunit